MPKPRYSQVSLEATPYYHCVSRCVRRAYLCGEDGVTGQCFEHRRGWIEDKLFRLSEVFALGLCAYAVMSNHYHVVLQVQREQVEQWSLEEVIARWHTLFSGSGLSRRYAQGEALWEEEQKVLEAEAELWRERLTSISWFMRCLNESIARAANQEDGCTGRFWEGRFTSQALLDEAALAACLAYVDLNPLRAGLATTPEASAYTSIQKRAQRAQQAHQPNHPRQQTRGLVPFAGHPRADLPEGLPFRLTEYLELVDWSGRMLRDDKRGAMESHLPPILTRLQIDPRQWQTLTTRLEVDFKTFIGKADTVKHTCEALGYQRTPGITACAIAFS